MTMTYTDKENNQVTCYSIEEKIAGIETLSEALASGNVDSFYMRELGYYNDIDRLDAICLHLKWYDAMAKV